MQSLWWFGVVHSLNIDTCSYASLHAGPWACMQFPELACSSLSFHEVSWAYMKFHELACSFMSLHPVSLACMQFLSLSEQLTRISQCLLFVVSNCSCVKLYTNPCLALLLDVTHLVLVSALSPIAWFLPLSALTRNLPWSWLLPHRGAGRWPSLFPCRWIWICNL